MIKMMITVVIIFTLCWLPFNILMALGTKDGDFWKLPGMLYIWFVCHWLAMSHACYNPIIYCWMNARFRNGFRYVFRRLLCSRSMISKKRWDDDNSLKRCNTYTTSCTSVRPTSIQGVGSHSAMKSNRDSHSHVKNVKPSELISLRDSHYNSAHRDENGDDEDPTSETHI